MPNSKCKIIIGLFIAVGLVMPALGLAQERFGAAMPQTIGEAKEFATAILLKLPDAVKRIWSEEALPILQNMWEWAKPKIEPWWNKFLGIFNKEVEKRKPDIEKEFQKEKEEMQKDLWKRFKDLLK